MQGIAGFGSARGTPVVLRGVLLRMPIAQAQRRRLDVDGTAAYKLRCRRCGWLGLDRCPRPGNPSSGRTDARRTYPDPWTLDTNRFKLRRAHRPAREAAPQIAASAVYLPTTYAG